MTVALTAVSEKVTTNFKTNTGAGESACQLVFCFVFLIVSALTSD